MKVEPERWYYWCDKMGLLVWQDMPSGNNDTPEARKQYEAEMKAMITGRNRHPSIIMWVVFNEGWGQFDTERMTGSPSRWIRPVCQQCKRMDRQGVATSSISKCITGTG